MVSVILHSQLAYWTDGNLDEEKSDHKKSYIRWRDKRNGADIRRCCVSPEAVLF
jgi:hypothetical protein